MNFGTIEYICEVSDKNEKGYRVLNLTLVDEEDSDVFRRYGLMELRRRRILRLVREAEEQGCTLSYGDLAKILLTSVATLKRDVAVLEKRGEYLPLRGRRKHLSGLVKTGKEGVEVTRE